MPLNRVRSLPRTTAVGSILSYDSPMYEWGRYNERYFGNQPYGTFLSYSHSRIHDEHIALTEPEKEELRRLRRLGSFIPPRKGKSPYKLRPRQVEHWKCDIISSAGSAHAEFKAPGDVTVTCGGYLPPFSDTLTDVPLISPAKVDGAFKSFREQMPDQMLLPNFLWELRHPGKIVDNLVTLRNRFKGGSFQDLRRYLGKRWYTYNFEFVPLMQDIAAILTSYADVQKRIAFLKKTHGRPTTLRRSWLEDHTIQSTEWNVFHAENRPIGSYPYLTVEGRREPAKIKIRRVVGATMFHRLGALDDYLGMISGMLASYGFNKPLSVVWEAIPFSWLIDYFVKVGNFLDTIKSSEPFPGEITLTNGWVSTAVKDATISYSTRLVVPTWMIPQSGTELETQGALKVRLSYYNRTPGIPCTNGTHLQFGYPQTLQQYLNLAFLG